MSFLDEAVITVRSGDGGKGCVSFRREKFEPKGGPDGGNGGNGGGVVLRATRKLYTLSEYSSRKYFKAQNGGAGQSKDRSGRNGEDLLLSFPLGTVVRDDETGELLVDLTRDAQEVLLIPGGRGGKGNRHFATATHRTPRFAQPGTPGQEKRLRLSLKFLADVGLVGLPNAGKSTLLSRLTMAHPKIDDYPFTTLVPNLGVMHLEEGPLVLADIPGLIEGASQGRGLGLRFLRHIERTHLLLHLLDITYRPERDLLEDYYAVRHEMAAHNRELADKPHMVVMSKLDLVGPESRSVEEVRAALREIGVRSLSVSALTGLGLEELKEEIRSHFYG